jgi:hypothetical protein
MQEESALSSRSMMFSQRYSNGPLSHARKVPDVPLTLATQSGFRSSSDFRRHRPRLVVAIKTAVASRRPRCDGELQPKQSLPVWGIEMQDINVPHAVVEQS